MDSMNRAPAELAPKENVALGIVGALLFSLAGALCYFLLSRVGYIATISALVGAYCACFGYGLFAHKKDSKTGVIVAAVVTVLVMVLSVVFCLAFELYEFVQNDYANIKLTEAISDTVRSLFDSNYTIEYGLRSYIIDKGQFAKDLLISLVFTAVGIFSFATGQKNKRKAAQQAAQAQNMPPQTIPMPTPAQAPAEPTEAVAAPEEEHE